LTRILDLLSDYEGRLRDAVSKRIFVEVALLKAIEARGAVSLETVLQKLQALRSNDGTGSMPGRSASSVAAAPPPVPPRIAEPAPTAPRAAATSPKASPKAVESVAAVSPSSNPVPASAPAQAAASAETPSLYDLWVNVVDAVSRASPFARTYFLEAHPVSLVRNVLTIGYAPQFADHLGLVDNAKNRTLVQTKLEELGHPGVEVRFIQAEPPPGWARPEVAAPVAAASEPAAATASAATAPPAAPAATSAPQSKAPKPASGVSKEDFKNDPLIKQALEIFKGQIVEVRA
jgi:hypothetical protein